MIWYLNGTLPIKIIKQPRGLLIQGWHYIVLKNLVWPTTPPFFSPFHRFRPPSAHLPQETWDGGRRGGRAFNDPWRSTERPGQVGSSMVSKVSMPGEVANSSGSIRLWVFYIGSEVGWSSKWGIAGEECGGLCSTQILVEDVKLYTSHRYTCVLKIGGVGVMMIRDTAGCCFKVFEPFHHLAWPTLQVLQVIKHVQGVTYI